MKKLLFLVLILISNLSFSQEESPIKKDLKVGLVLSGGGAKGYAHVGVLKVIEKAGVRIDYIAGTSMGAIIGGLYASGYSANQLDSILKAHDFSELTNDNVPREAYSFYQKRNKRKHAISLPMRKWKIGLPKSISKGQNILNLLSQLTEHVHQVDDFSKLPIPFFCISTNLVTGEEVVLDHGFLPKAMRASSSFPSVYAPVEIDNKTLVDGGIVNNYPIELLKAKGVDYIIGVNVQGKLSDKDELTSVPSILMQIVGYQMYKGFEEKVEMTDLYLKPEVSQYGDFSFEAATEIIKAGEVVAKGHLTELKKIAERQQKNNKLNVNLQQDVGGIVVKKIEITGNKNYTYSYCLDKLQIKEGEIVSQDKFIKGIETLSATGNFESINYRFIHEKEGVNVQIQLIESEVSAYVKLGAHYDRVYKTGVLINFTKKHPLLKNDFLSVDFVIGDNSRYNLDYFVDNGKYLSYGLKTRYNAFDLDIFLKAEDTIGVSIDIGLKTPIKYSDRTHQFYVQTTIKNKFALRAGLEYKELRVSTQVVKENRTEKVYFEKSGYGNVFAKLIFDSYSSDYFPKRGLYFEANYKTYLTTFYSKNDFHSFSQLYGKIGYAITTLDKLTFQVGGGVGITIGNSDNSIHNYTLGGNNENFINIFEKFYGYDTADLSATSYLKGSLTLRYEIFKNNYLSLMSNFARVEDDLWEKGVFEDIKSGYGVGYGIKTFIGPMELKYTYSPDISQSIWFINLGYWF